MKGFILVVLAVIAILFTSGFASRTKQNGATYLDGNVMAGRRAEALVGTVIDGKYPWIEDYNPSTHVSLKFIDDIVYFCWVDLIASTEARKQNYAQIKPVLDAFVARKEDAAKEIFGAQQLPNGKNLKIGDLVATRVAVKTKSGQMNYVEKLAIVLSTAPNYMPYVVEAATVADVGTKKKTIVRKLPLDQFIAGIPAASVQYIRPNYWTEIELE